MRRAKPASGRGNADAGAVTRRDALFGALALAFVGSARAQPAPKVFRIGLLGGAARTSAASSHIWGGFFDGLRELGFVEGRNIVVEERFYGDDLVINLRTAKALGLAIPASLRARADVLIE